MQDLSKEQFQEIVDLYGSTIEFPAEKPNKQYVLCPVGLIGSGKTTVMKPLCKALNLVRISSDEVRQILKSKGFGYDSARKITIFLVEEFVNAGWSIALDLNCGSKNSFPVIQKYLSEHTIKNIWIKIAPPNEFIVNKLKNYEHTWLFKDSEQAIKAHLYNLKENGDFEHLPVKYTYTFDTSKDDLPLQLEEAKDKILKAIKE